MSLIEHFFTESVPLWIFLILVITCLCLVVETILSDTRVEDAENRALRAENKLREK